jgi:hypothetical protein
VPDSGKDEKGALLKESLSGTGCVMVFLKYFRVQQKIHIFPGIFMSIKERNYFG